jgi:hypothetical protein
MITCKVEEAARKIEFSDAIATPEIFIIYNFNYKRNNFEKKKVSTRFFALDIIKVLESYDIYTYTRNNVKICLGIRTISVSRVLY